LSLKGIGILPAVQQNTVLAHSSAIFADLNKHFLLEET